MTKLLLILACAPLAWVFQMACVDIARRFIKLPQRRATGPPILDLRADKGNTPRRIE